MNQGLVQCETGWFMLRLSVIRRSKLSFRQKKYSLARKNRSKMSWWFSLLVSFILAHAIGILGYFTRRIISLSCWLGVSFRLLSLGFFRLQCVSGLNGLRLSWKRKWIRLDISRVKLRLCILKVLGHWVQVSGLGFAVDLQRLFRRISTAYIGWKYLGESRQLFMPLSGFGVFILQPQPHARITLA